MATRLSKHAWATPFQRASAKPKPAVPGLLLAETWAPGDDVNGWWLSEKLDGVLAYWDGKQFWSRQGNRFYAPDWFTAGLPNTPLDGELWMGRRAFQRAVSIVRRQDESDHWRELRYVIFDVPGRSGVFENRLAFIERRLKPLQPAFAEPRRHYRCRGEAHLESELERITALGGEGFMLREPGSRYQAGRSSTLLKAKRFQDGDALVTGHEPGSGRHPVRLGALLARLP